MFDELTTGELVELWALLEIDVKARRQVEDVLIAREKGSAASGNWGHTGYPGIGGSSRGGGLLSIGMPTDSTAAERREQAFQLRTSREVGPPVPYEEFSSVAEATRWMKDEGSYFIGFVGADWDDLTPEAKIEAASTLRQLHELSPDVYLNSITFTDEAKASIAGSTYMRIGETFTKRTRVEVWKDLKKDTPWERVPEETKKELIAHLDKNIRAVETGKFEGKIPHSLMVFPDGQQMRAAIAHEWGHATFGQVKYTREGAIFRRLLGKYQVSHDRLSPTRRSEDSFEEFVAESYALFSGGHYHMLEPEVIWFWRKETKR